MTNYDAANKEWEEAKNWAITEEKKVLSRLKKEGKLSGLDGNREDFAYIREGLKRRLREIKAKYQNES